MLATRRRNSLFPSRTVFKRFAMGNKEIELSLERMRFWRRTTLHKLGRFKSLSLAISRSVRPLSHWNQERSQALPGVVEGDDRRARQTRSPCRRVGLGNEKHEVRMPVSVTVA